MTTNVRMMILDVVDDATSSFVPPKIQIQIEDFGGSFGIVDLVGLGDRRRGD
jgi:hypothetical protein